MSNSAKDHKQNLVREHFRTNVKLVYTCQSNDCLLNDWLMTVRRLVELVLLEAQRINSSILQEIIVKTFVIPAAVVKYKKKLNTES